MVVTRQDLGELAPDVRDRAFAEHRAYLAAREAEMREHDVLQVGDYWDYLMKRSEHVDNVCAEEVDETADGGHAIRCVTYREMDERVTAVALVLRKRLQPLLTECESVPAVALVMSNGIDFLVSWLAMAKLGIIVPLINIQLHGAALQHSLDVSDVCAIFCGDEHVKTVQEVSDSPIWRLSQVQHEADEMTPLDACENEKLRAKFSRLRRHGILNFDFESEANESNVDVRDADAAQFLIFTSGTTGPSKAAIFSHRRFYGAGFSWCGSMHLVPEDRYYVCLPLFHGNGGVVAVAAAWQAGARLVLRRKFSASKFWKDVANHGCTAMIYIGELWRFLLNRPTEEFTQYLTASESPLQVIAGNGLTSDTYSQVKQRFGVRYIVEHYGMTEMPAGPYLNFFGRPGACGYLPPHVRESERNDTLISYDVDSDQPIRRQGRCIDIGHEVDKPGMAIFRLLSEYRGYHRNPVATEKRILRNVFEEGDAWFATGDLLRMDVDGFFYFVDRAGDTFRWKGENVATGEVSDVIAEVSSVVEANVYGVKVPHRGGRCGMASLCVDTDVGTIEETLKQVFAVTESKLPHYARPLFLRIAQENAKTATLKFRKSAYVAAGFDPVECDGDALFFRSTEGYVPLDERLRDNITRDASMRL
ncbi:MAG: hypothetical protein MHM6MM_004175 [Cercozoa sp. M6MM]